MANGTLQARVRLPSISDTGARRGRGDVPRQRVQTRDGTVKLRATIRNADRHFWPGQFRQRPVDSHHGDGGAGPESGDADQLSKGVSSTSSSRIRPSSSGGHARSASGRRRGVTTGVASGEEVVVTGQLTVAPGAKVRIAPPAARRTTRKTNVAASRQKMTISEPFVRRPVMTVVLTPRHPVRRARVLRTARERPAAVDYR